MKKKTRNKRVVVTLDANTFKRLLDLARMYNVAPEQMAQALLKQQLVIVGHPHDHDHEGAYQKAA